MHFVVRYRDRPGTGDLRKAHHPEHIQFRKGLGARVVLSGPLLSPESGQPVGSLIVLEAADLKAATETAGDDPLAVHGVFEVESVTPFRVMAFNPPAQTGAP